MKLNIILFAILIILSTVRVFAQESQTELGLTFELDTMTEEQLDQELDELVDIKAIEDVKHCPDDMAE